MRTPSRLLVLSSALAFAGAVHAVDDGPPIDIRAAIEALEKIKDAQGKQLQSVRGRAIQEAAAAAADTGRAVNLWEEAIRATQFQGASKEGAAWRDWKEKEGDALKEKEVHTALRLHFNWLAITLKHADGVATTDLLPAIMAHMREAMADEAAMDALDEAMKKEKDAITPLAGAAKAKASNQRDRDKLTNNAGVKRMHDQIAKGGLGSSAYVEWMKLSDMIQEVAPSAAGGGGGGAGRGARTQRQQQPKDLPGARKREAPDETWESVPANVDGLFNNIIQPSLRANNDPHVVDYWDYRLRHEADLATRTKLQFEIDRFNQIRRPQLLWGRLRDLASIGLKNRATSDMLALIKANATHPDATAWADELEGLLTPSAAPPAGTSASGAPAPSQ
jgi:hypothetical protein